jgi:hypothetical protein
MVRAAGDFAEAYDQGDCLKSAAAVKGLAPSRDYAARLTGMVQRADLM